MKDQSRSCLTSQNICQNTFTCGCGGCMPVAKDPKGVASPWAGKGPAGNWKVSAFSKEVFIRNFVVGCCNGIGEKFEQGTHLQSHRVLKFIYRNLNSSSRTRWQSTVLPYENIYHCSSTSGSASPHSEHVVFFARGPVKAWYELIVWYTCRRLVNHGPRRQRH